MSSFGGLEEKGAMPKRNRPFFFKSFLTLGTTIQSPLQLRPFPSFPGFWAMLGPGIVWMALAQGSGELIWWPYLIAKYGLTFLFLLIPACLLQYPVNYAIGSYTMLTGESIFQGFIRHNRFLALLLWILMTLSFLWFGAFAAAGGTALQAMTDFPHGWNNKAQTLFWAYLSMILFLLAIFFSRRIYPLIEGFMWVVAVVTLVGLIVASFHQEVQMAFPRFAKAIFRPEPLPRPWEATDATKLLTAISFAGLGGFWTLFYSYWLKEKGVGMAAYGGRITSPIVGTTEAISEVGFTFKGEEQELKEARRWKKFLLLDSSIGIFGNIVTTLLNCLLAFALLHPKGLLPQGYELAVTQARFFEVSWGGWGWILFLFVAACFLSDTWFTTLDAVSRIQADFFHSFFPAAKGRSFRWWYYFFVGFLTVITFITTPLAEPGALILLSAVLGFIGTVIFTFALYLLHRNLLPRLIPPAACLGRGARFFLGVSGFFYLVLAIAYFAALR